MKFGKTFRLSAKPEWEEFQVDYKKLKQLIKRMMSEPGVPGEDKETEFLRALNREWVKVENFLRKKCDTLVELVAHVNHAVEHKMCKPGTPRAKLSIESKETVPASGSEPPAAASASPSPSSAAPTNSEPLPAPRKRHRRSRTSGEYAARDANATAADAPMPAAPDAKEETKITAPPEVMDPPVPAASAPDNWRHLLGRLQNTDPTRFLDERKIPLRIRLTRLENLIVGLLEFVAMNCKAYVKITKKFDKKIERAIQPSANVRAAASKATWKRAFGDLHKDVLTLMEQVPAPPMPSPDRSFEDVLAPDESDAYTVTELELGALPPGRVTHLRLIVMTGPLGDVMVPVIVAKGRYDGPVVGITCAVHGNELNGIPVIWNLVRELDVTEMAGTLVAVPVVNPEGFLRQQREFSDGVDLNRVFPGKPRGDSSSVFTHKFLNLVVRRLHYLVDLHTASFGRANSLYVRADMTDKVAREMALLQNPQIVVHNSSPEGSMRSAAMDLGVSSITVEIGDSGTFDKTYLKVALQGIENILSHLKMLKLPVVPQDKMPTVCSKSYWIFAQHGGVLEVLPPVNTWVKKGQVYARVRNVFGDVVALYKAPEDGIIVGKSVNPVCMTGDRLIHLGVAGETFAAKQQDGR